MDDLISRQRAIAVADSSDYVGLSVEDCKKVTDEVVKGLKQLPSAQPESQWIPCSERLPEVRRWVLCQCRANIMDVLRLTDDGSWYRQPNTIYMDGFVLAWMPLPEPYQEVENEQS